MYERLREKFRSIVNEYNWEGEEVKVVAQTLSSEEAIGNPEEDDYPLLKGRERRFCILTNTSEVRNRSR